MSALAAVPPLPVPAEPTALRERLYAALLADPPAPAALSVPGGGDGGGGAYGPFEAWLWEEWQPSLAAAGMDRESFVGVVAGCRREIWLWLAGERPWQHCAEGLAGRVVRRLPAGAADADGA